MLKFLEQVWPTTGNYLVAHPYSNGGFNQIAFADIESAAKQSAMWSKQNLDVYFAVGSVASLGTSASRKGADIKEFRTFILDIDCGDGKDYASQSEAIEALKTAVTVLALPKPTLVSSGYGWHCYWPLTESISADSWQQTAYKFKMAVAHAGLRADPSRTSDRASVLRVPDTINYKRGGRAEVRVVKTGSPTSPEEFSRIISEYFEFNNLQEPELKVKVYANTEMDDVLNSLGIAPNTAPVYEPADFNAILEHCNALRYAVNNSDKLSEPFWRGALSIAKYCEGSDEHIHSVSENHEEYSVARTEAKTDAIDIPFTCTYFKQHSGQCDGCENSCNSPISFGRPQLMLQTIGSPLLSPTISIMPASESYEAAPEQRNSVGGWTCDYPAGYGLNFSGITATVSSPDELGEFKKRQITISSYPIRFVKRVHDFASREDIAFFQVMLPQDNWRDIEIRLRDMTEPKGGKVCSSLGSIGCIIDGKEQKYVGEFMSSYLKQVIANAAAVKNYAQMGWAEDGDLFVLADKSITREGGVLESGAASNIGPITNAMRKRGTLEDWLKVVNVYARDGYEPYAFGHSIAYGSLLFKFTDFEGAIVTLLGDSGSGKSTVLRTVNSVFGHPKDLMLQQRDNDVAKFIQIAAMRNIAPCYDEISNIDPKELSDLCYGISQGRDKRRGAQNGGLRNDELTWCCIMPVTSNHSLYERLSSYKSDASAESMRVFEYHVRSDMHVLSKTEAQEIFEPLSDNYGHAGEIFVTWLVQNQDKAKERVRYWRNRFDEEAKVPNRERYWSSIVGATLAGAELSSNLGLNCYDVEKLYTFVLAQIKVARGTVSENRKSPTSMLVEFMNQSIRSTIVLGGGTVEKGKDTSLWVKQEPMNGLVARIEIDKNVAYLSRAALRKWVIEAGGDYDSMRKELVASKIVVSDRTDKILSSGSATFKSGQTTCWVVDLAHPQMAGGVQLQVVKMPAIENKKQVADGKPF